MASNCASETWAGIGAVWLSTQVWYFVAGSTPEGLDVDNTESSLRGAAGEWYDNENNCGVVDEASVALAYGGRIASSFGRNDLSTRGFGDVAEIGCSTVAVACTQIWPGDGNPVITEADVRFNTFATWVNGGAQYAYDVWSVAAHETGHTIGMDEDFAGCVQCNVMWHEASTNDMSDRLLGLGDAVANNNRY